MNIKEITRCLFCMYPTIGNIFSHFYFLLSFEFFFMVLFSNFIDFCKHSFFRFFFVRFFFMSFFITILDKNTLPTAN